MEDYRVQLDFYDGPMDLLLYLVRRNEVDINDVPIARITEQYCRYVEMIRALDMNLAAEFVLMAAWLMEIKTRLLLPTPPPEGTDEEGGSAAAALADPRAELVRQLLAYRRFKELAGELGEAAAEQALKHPRAGIDWELIAGQAEEQAIDLAEVQIWDLLDAFGRLMEATGRAAIHEVTYDDTPVQEYETEIVRRLEEGGPVLFEKLFASRTRGQIIGMFLALLELIRRRRVRARQEGPFGAISLELRDEAEPVGPTPAGGQEQVPGEGPADTTAEPGSPGQVGLTWVEPDLDDESADQTLLTIEQELRAVRLPPDPETFLPTQPQPAPPGSPPEAENPSP